MGDIFSPQQLDKYAKKYEAGPKLTIGAPQTETRAPRGFSPTTLGLMGSGADGLSTYAMMRGGRGEDNNTLQGMSPGKTGLATAGMGLAGVAGYKLLAKKFPKLARILAVNHAASQIGTAGRNFSGYDNLGASSIESYNRDITDNIQGYRRK